jgi:hypothetical protein
MKKWAYSNWLYVAGALIGAAGGFAYYHFIGCNSGSCAITSKPVNSTLYFALFGSVLFGMFKKEKSSEAKNN